MTLLRCSIPRAAASLLCGLVVLSPLLRHPGLPHAHDRLRPVAAMAVIAARWRLGELIPLWSTTAAFGLGSPAPALYHKVFSYAAALGYLTTANAKLSVCAALLGFMVCGFLGAAAAVRALCGAPRLALECLAGALLLTSNYATTDWQVRDAYAEFAAMMLVPWLFAWCFSLLHRGRWSVGSGAWMGVLVLTHSALALFALAPLGVAVLLSLLRWRRAALAWWRPGLLSVLLAAAIDLPFLLPIAALIDYPRVDLFFIYNLRTGQMPFVRLFWDPLWSWRSTDWRGFTVQLDTLPLITFAWVPLLLPGPARDRAWAAGFLLLVVAGMLALQLPQATLLLEAIPGGAYLQFAWRLMVFIVPAMIFGVILLLDTLCAAGHRRLAVACGVALLAASAVDKPWTIGIPRDWFTSDEVAAAARETGRDSAPEYFPKMRLSWQDETRFLAHAAAQPAACTVAPSAGAEVEARTARFTVTCPIAGRAALPALLVRGLAVTASGRTLPAIRSCDDPRAQLDLPGGVTEVSLRYPSYLSVLSAWLRDGAASPPCS